MNNSKHTPGPWEAVKYINGKTPEWIIRNKTFGNKNPSESRTLCTPNEADAYLIAAAPTLLDRLTECLGYLEASNAPKYFIKSVKAAIAKAEGKE